MIGSPALVLGIAHYSEDDPNDAYWTKFQLFTGEEYLESADPGLKNYAAKNVKYHGDTIILVGKQLQVLKKVHDFDLGEAPSVEITKEEADLLHKELAVDGWQDFDWETWGK
jgi:hypothetical protein